MLKPAGSNPIAHVFARCKPGARCVKLVLLRRKPVRGPGRGAFVCIRLTHISNMRHLRHRYAHPRTSLHPHHNMCKRIRAASATRRGRLV